MSPRIVATLLSVVLGSVLAVIKESWFTIPGPLMIFWGLFGVIQCGRAIIWYLDAPSEIEGAAACASLSVLGLFLMAIAGAGGYLIIG